MKTRIACQRGPRKLQPCEVPKRARMLSAWRWHPALVAVARVAWFLVLLVTAGTFFGAPIAALAG